MTAFCLALETVRDLIGRLLKQQHYEPHHLKNIIIPKSIAVMLAQDKGLAMDSNNMPSEDRRVEPSYLLDLANIENQVNLLKLKECYVDDFCSLA